MLLEIWLTSLIDFRTKKGKNEKIQWLLRRWFFTVLRICVSQNKYRLLLLFSINTIMDLWPLFLFWFTPPPKFYCLLYFISITWFTVIRLNSHVSLEESGAQRGQETWSRSHRGKKSCRSLVPKPVLAPYAMLFFPVNVFPSCGAGKH